MKIHSSVLTRQHFHAALKAAPGVHFADLSEQGSRSRAKAFNVLLESDGTPDAGGKPRRFARNVGKAGRYPGEHPGYAASYDDWGRFLACLFLVDPDAIAGPYKGAEDFHAKTEGAYQGSSV